MIAHTTKRKGASVFAANSKRGTNYVFWPKFVGQAEERIIRKGVSGEGIRGGKGVNGLLILDVISQRKHVKGMNEGY